MNKIIIDLDNTITIEDGSIAYSNKLPNLQVVDKLRFFKSLGYEIVIFTARNMNSYSGALGKINVHTLPIILDWLKIHDVPYDEVIVGKPWCGSDGFYVDDRALRPSEFINMSPTDIKQLLDEENND